MVVNPSDRRHSVTKNANYASIALDRAPGDVHWTGSPANVKQAEQQLQKQTEIMQTTHRKSLIHMDAQRKMLEKSMLAYSEKMKNISKDRTGDMPTKRAFKVRRDSDTQSLTGFSDSERIDMPVNSGDLRKRRRSKAKRHYRKREQMFSPIVEANARAAGKEAVPTPDENENFQGLRRAFRRSSSADQINQDDLLYLNTSRTEGNEPISNLDFFSDSDIPHSNDNSFTNAGDGHCSISVIPADNGNYHAHSEANKTDSSVHLPEIQITNSPLLGVPSSSASRRGSASSNSSNGSSGCDDCSLRSYNSATDGDDFNSPRSVRSSIAGSSLTSTPGSSTESLSKKKSKRKNKNIKDAFADDSEAEVMLTVPRRHFRQRSNSKSKKDADTLLRTTVLKNAYRKSADFGAEHFDADDSENWVGRSRAFTH